MRRVFLLLAGITLVAGCSDAAKNSDPKVAPGSTPPPGLKPAEVGGATSGAKVQEGGSRIAN